MITKSTHTTKYVIVIVGSLKYLLLVKEEYSIVFYTLIATLNFISIPILYNYVNYISLRTQIISAVNKIANTKENSLKKNALYLVSFISRTVRIMKIMIKNGNKSRIQIQPRTVGE
jgi:cell division protein FtsL